MAPCNHIKRTTALGDDIFERCLNLRSKSGGSIISDLSDDMGDSPRRAIFPRTDSGEFAVPSGSASVPTASYRVLRSPPRASSGSEIRSRLLHRLGFAHKKPRDGPASNSFERSPVIRKDRTNAFQDVLKDDYGKHDNLLEAKSNSSMRSLSTSPGGLNRSRSSRSVSFDASVQVHLIPSHSDYSERVRPTLWPSGKEMQQDVVRNCVEFAAEGWDWTQCNEKMILYRGEPIHPVHFVAERNLNWHFCAVRAMQQSQQS